MISLRTAILAVVVGIVLPCVFILITHRKGLSEQEDCTAICSPYAVVESVKSYCYCSNNSGILKRDKPQPER